VWSVTFERVGIETTREENDGCVRSDATTDEVNRRCEPFALESTMGVSARRRMDGADGWCRRRLVWMGFAKASERRGWNFAVFFAIDSNGCAREGVEFTSPRVDCFVYGGVGRRRRSRGGVGDVTSLEGEAFDANLSPRASARARVEYMMGVKKKRGVD